MIIQTIKSKFKAYSSGDITLENLIEDLEENTLELDRTNYKNFKNKLKEVILNHNKKALVSNKTTPLYCYNFDAIEDNGMRDDEELIEIHSLVDFEIDKSYYIEIELIEEEDKYKEGLDYLLEDVKRDVSTLPIFLAKVDNNKYAITTSYKEDLLNQLPKLIEEYNKTNEDKYIIYRNLFSNDIVFYECRDNECINNYYLSWEIIDM